MSAGAITLPPGIAFAQSWAMPGTNLTFVGAQDSELMFQVLSTTQDVSSNTIVTTNFFGDFSSVPHYGAGNISIRVHPAPIFTCINCTGDPQVVDLSQAICHGRPLYSCTSRTYTGSAPGMANSLGTASNTTQSARSWGNLSSLEINVTTPFTGTGGQLDYSVGSPFNNYRLIKPDGSTCNYSPQVNLNQAGKRLITPVGVTGDQIGDGTLSVTGFCGVATGWFHDDRGLAASRDISGQSPTVWPTVTITIMTDQGVVIPPR
jgi:hypothetical protein